MSIRIMTMVWESSPVKGTELLVMLSLADNANDEGVCWPSINTIARKCRISRRYAIEILSQLEGRNLIRVQNRRDGELNKSNIYTIVLDSSLWVVNPSSPCSEPEDTIPSEPEITKVVNPSSPKPSFNRKLLTVKKNRNDDVPTPRVETPSPAVSSSPMVSLFCSTFSLPSLEPRDAQKIAALEAEYGPERVRKVIEWQYLDKKLLPAEALAGIRKAVAGWREDWGNKPAKSMTQDERSAKMHYEMFEGPFAEFYEK